MLEMGGNARSYLPSDRILATLQSITQSTTEWVRRWHWNRHQLSGKMEILIFFRCVEDHWPSHFIYSISILRIVILVGVLEHELYFPFHIWDVILPIDKLIFFRGVGQPPTSIVSAIDSSAGLGFSVTTHFQNIDPPKSPWGRENVAQACESFAHQSVKAKSRDFMVSIWRRRSSSLKTGVRISNLNETDDFISVNFTN